MSSTPISKLPVNHPNLQISGDSQEDDPEVQAVLQEVQQRQPAPPMVQTQMYAVPPPQQMMMAPSPRVPPMVVESSNPWVQPEMAKKAVIAAVLAAMLFHPKTLAMLYERIAFLQKFESYDVWIRMALLAVVLYLLMIKLKL